MIDVVTQNVGIYFNIYFLRNLNYDLQILLARVSKIVLPILIKTNTLIITNYHINVLADYFVQIKKYKSKLKFKTIILWTVKHKNTYN